jgi:hypothetical protein
VLVVVFTVGTDEFVACATLKMPNGFNANRLGPTANGLKNRGRTFAVPRVAVCACPIAAIAPQSDAETATIRKNLDNLMIS